MSVCNDIADYEWLTGNEAAALLDEWEADDVPLHTAVERLRGRLAPAVTHLLLEQVELRRRARAKFTAASRMFFTRLALEQATDEVIARYKANKLVQRAGLSTPPVFADLCCGIGGDLLALARRGVAVGVDCNPNVAHFARANALAALGAEYAARVTVEVADAEDWDLNGVEAWHIDPDRRANGRRTTSLAYCKPALPTLERLLDQVPHAGIKLAPATDVPTAWRQRCELEWISRCGECKQLVAWHGDLAAAPGRRRATVVFAKSVGRVVLDPDIAVRTVVGNPGECADVAKKVEAYVFDVDAAVLAAGLSSALAAGHGLRALSGGATYLTAPSLINDPALACFKVQEVFPIQIRVLAKYLRAHGIGVLEIKTRGVDVSPDALRKELKLRGDNAATLLVTRVAGRRTAILAQRVSRKSS